jgi:hypothetical protein
MTLDYLRYDEPVFHDAYRLWCLSPKFLLTRLKLYTLRFTQIDMEGRKI